MSQLKNKRALVPGDGNGIGRAICKLLAGNGAWDITESRPPLSRWHPDYAERAKKKCS